jgi:Na+/melibiose symporter-like transporter
MHKPARRTPSFKEMAREVGLAISNRNFVALAVSGLIFGIAIGITGGLLTYFLTYFWELPSSALLQLGFWTIPGGLIGLIVAPYGARRLGKKRACLIVFFLAIFSTTVPISLRLLGVLPPNSSPWVLRILIVDSLATGLLSTMGFVIVTSMLADVVEEVQLLTGRRSEGVLFAADSLLRKITQSFAVALPGLMLDFVRFPKHAKPGHVDTAILNHLALIYLPLVTALYLCSTSMILLYRIDRRRHEDNLDRLAQAAAIEAETDPELNPHLAPDVISGAV